MINHDAVLAYFTGKAKEKAEVALTLIESSLAQGYWIKGASRKVEAALSKAAVAQKFAGQNQSRLSHNLFMGLTYGFRHLKPYYEIDRELLLVHAVSEQEKELASYALAFADVMAPVYVLIDQLDMTRPPPVFTEFGVSPTITKTLIQMSLRPDSARIPPMHHEKHEWTNPKTRKREVLTILVIDWPESTLHNETRFGIASQRHPVKDCQHCHACGHGIRNPHNWVPLLFNSNDGGLKSMWVGKDCAASLFGIIVKGDVNFKEGTRE